MAEVVSCDLCGKSPANRVEVGIVLYGVAAPDAPTGSSECVDACESCQVAAVDKLVEHVKATLGEQVPFHAQIMQHNAAIEEHQVTVAQTTAAVRAHIEANGEIATLPDKIRLPHENALMAVADAEADRAAVLVEAQKVHDARVKKFRGSLKKRK